MNHQLHQEKAALRTQVRQQRRLLSDQQYAAGSRAICNRLMSLDELQNVRTVHTFWPIHANREVDIIPYITFLMGTGVQVVLPVRPSAGTMQMEHRRFTTQDDLVPSPWGGLEPEKGQLVSCDILDAVIVPAMAVDPLGTRLGYGGGYYDRFLDSVDIPRICPIFHDLLFPSLPREDHDIPVSVIVTEKSTVRPT